MQDEKKASFFKKIFGRKSSCCSLEFEEVDSNEGHVPAPKNTVVNSCCDSPTNSNVKKAEDRRE